MKQLDKEASQELVNHETVDSADFETAITATGFGKFNYLLLFVAMIISLAMSFATTTMSYVAPVAECDLSLSLTDKGMLNGSVYLGTLSSVLIWGFLADTYGRRKLQILGLFFDTFCNIGCVLSKSFIMLFIFKYFSGFSGCGPYTIMLSYIAEFHSTRYRSKIVVFVGIFICLGNAILPFIAWWILPMDISFNLYFIRLNSWRVFLAICTIPSFVGTIAQFFLPESPKFLMSNNKNKEALIIFQQIYKLNSGNNKKTFPIKALKQEKQVSQHLNNLITNNNTNITFRSSLKQMKTLFYPPYLWNMILVIVLQTAIMLGSNTLRLWLPQFFITISEFQEKNNHTDSSSLCEMLSYDKIKFNSTGLPEECTVEYKDDQIYINSVIVSICGVISFIFVGNLINAMGKKYLLVITFAITSITGIANYWAKNSIALLTFSSIFVSLGTIATQVIFAVTVELFPTSLRTIVNSMTMIFGRLGAISGNVIFALLLEIGCLPPFLLISGITLIGTIFSCFLPKRVPEFK